MQKIIFFLILIFSTSLNAELLFKPFHAHTFEPRIGSFNQYQDEKLRLDIGYSHDIATFDLDEKSNITIGADFFTYTRLRSEGKFKFPVETSDYFFGLNSSYKTAINGKDFGVRFRIAHISSHLVDGYTNNGEFIKEPFTYSREFLDLAAGYYIWKQLRLYAGINYVFSTIPKNIEAITPQIGFDIHHKLYKNIEIVGGFDHRTVGVEEVYAGSNSFEAGINIITSEKAKINLTYIFMEGRSIHGMFYQDRDTYSGIGFRVIFY
jgi:hypothetical protein